MAFTDGSKGFVKRVASSLSMRKKKNTTSEPKLLPRSKSTGSSNYESQKLKKTLDVTDKTRIKSSQPKREKIDDLGLRKFGKWRSFDDSDSIWLSSDCSFHFAVDESVVSWLSSLAKSSLSLNHQDLSSSIKDHPKVPKNVKEKDSSSSDSSTQSSQGKKVSFTPSSGTELESEKNADTLDSKKSTDVVDEPLFWPYEQRFDWTPEDVLKHFSMSPRRKKLLNAKAFPGTSPRSMRVQLLQPRKLELKEGNKRKLVLNSSITNTSELKSTISNKKDDNIKKNPIKNCVRRNKSLPSRLRKSSKTCSKVVPIEASEEVITTKKLINRRSKTMVEDDFAFITDDFSIEKAVGLDEFKGREGVDSDFNSSTFLFDDPLCM